MCGIVGVINGTEADQDLTKGMFALQHRGPQGAGKTTFDTLRPYTFKKNGLVREIFGSEDSPILPGDIGIGHTRYVNTGEDNSTNQQPFTQIIDGKLIAYVHNGNFENYESIRNGLEIHHGIKLQTDTDSEVIGPLMQIAGGNSLDEMLVGIVGELSGDFNIIAIDQNQMAAIRDPWGFRPLTYGLKGDTHFFASESVALDKIDAEFIRVIEPGEVAVLSRESLKSGDPLQVRRYAERIGNGFMCAAELAYYSNPVSRLSPNGISVYELQVLQGMELAKTHPIEGDKKNVVITSLPDSGNGFADGYAQANSLARVPVFLRNHFSGKTFLSRYSERKQNAQDKMLVNPNLARGKDVYIGDDSIFRLDTLRGALPMIKSASPRSIHIRISLPPVRGICPYSINIPEISELVAAQYLVNGVVDTQRLAKDMAVDSIAFNSVEGYRQANEPAGIGLCTGCLDLNYPTRTHPMGRYLKT